uniref:Uncharacterized protein n=1 Tax=Anguilla anguilla TaxID=7936 RepID=A0A0E9QUW9_ANGAN
MEDWAFFHFHHSMTFRHTYIKVEALFMWLKKKNGNKYVITRPLCMISPSAHAVSRFNVFHPTARKCKQVNCKRNTYCYIHLVSQLISLVCHLKMYLIE